MQTTAAPHQSAYGPPFTGQPMHLVPVQSQWPAVVSAPWQPSAPTMSIPTQQVTSFPGSRQLDQRMPGQPAAMRSQGLQRGAPITDAFAGDLGLGSDDDDSMDDEALCAAVAAAECEHVAEKLLPTQRYHATTGLGTGFMSAPVRTAVARQSAAPSMTGLYHTSTLVDTSAYYLHFSCIVDFWTVSNDLPT